MLHYRSRCFHALFFVTWILLAAVSPSTVSAQTDRSSETGVVAEQGPSSRTHAKTWWVLPTVGSMTQGLGSLSAQLPDVNLASLGQNIRTRIGSVFPASFPAILNDIRQYWVIIRPLLELAIDQLQKNFIVLQRWEYRVIDVPEPAANVLEEHLNRQGNDGWECISIVPGTIPGPTGGPAMRCTFKRKPMSRFRAGIQVLNLLLSGSASTPVE